MEKLAGLLHGHFEDVGNALSFIFYLQRLAVIALSAAHLAGHKNVGQKVHLYLDNAVSETVLAPTARNVERKPARLISPLLRVGSHGE